MMSMQSLDRRLAALEREVGEWKRFLTNGKRDKDWRRTIGMFAGDEVMKQIDEETLKLREADRRRARRQPQFHQLKKGKIQIGTQDLKIASIVLVNDGLLLSANLKDFKKIPGLRVENWLE